MNNIELYCILSSAKLKLSHRQMHKYIYFLQRNGVGISLKASFTSRGIFYKDLPKLVESLEYEKLIWCSFDMFSSGSEVALSLTVAGEEILNSLEVEVSVVEQVQLINSFVTGQSSDELDFLSVLDYKLCKELCKTETPYLSSCKEYIVNSTVEFFKNKFDLTNEDFDNGFQLILTYINFKI